MIRNASMTAARFEELAATLGPCELIRGEVVELSPAGFEHSHVCFRVSQLLGDWAREHAKGRLLSGEAGLIVESDPDTIRGADVAYFSYERMPKGKEPRGFSSVPPELVVEIVGKGQGWGEMVERAGEYLRMGVDRVWVIDPTTRRLHVFRSDVEPVTLNAGDPIEDKHVLPGFSITVGSFFDD